jgi:hypothetical protein
MKIEIEIPGPPEGWVFDGYRKGFAGEMVLLDDGRWVECKNSGTVYKYLMAVKAKPLWEPLPELASVLLGGWITRDRSTRVVLHSEKPFRFSAAWDSKGHQVYLNCVRPELLPPVTIPWEKCCFKIGEPNEN